VQKQKSLFTKTLIISIDLGEKAVCVKVKILKIAVCAVATGEDKSSRLIAKFFTVNTRRMSFVCSNPMLRSKIIPKTRFLGLCKMFVPSFGGLYQSLFVFRVLIKTF